MNLANMDPRRLPRLESPMRIKWLRLQVSAYICELAARAYFRLPMHVAGQLIPDPKLEAATLCANLAAQHQLTADEQSAAFKAEWDASMRAAVEVGEKIRIVALSQIKISGSAAGITQSLQQARTRFPVHWPYLTDENLDAIAAGFRRPAQRQRVG